MIKTTAITIRFAMLGLALALLIVPISASNTLPNSDGDKYADDNDICPNDPNNECADAKVCQELDSSIKSWETAANEMNWASFILGIIGVLGGLACSGLGAVYGIIILINCLYSMVYCPGQIDKLEDEMEDFGCYDKLGWQ